MARCGARPVFRDCVRAASVLRRGAGNIRREGAAQGYGGIWERFGRETSRSDTDQRGAPGNSRGLPAARCSGSSATDEILERTIAKLPYRLRGSLWNNDNPTLAHLASNHDDRAFGAHADLANPML
jgi:hypothetical protein